MRIETYLNTTKEEVGMHQHNIWIGISQGNKYFTKRNIENYIRWALDHTKDHVLIVIVDSIQAINQEVFDGKSKKVAYQRVLRLGDRLANDINNILKNFSEQERKIIKVRRWNDIVKNEEYLNRLKIVRQEYNYNDDFRNYIIQTIKEGRPDRIEKIKKLSNEKLDQLADYVLQEIPFFVNGVKDLDNTIYTLIPYPGISMLDKLFISLQKGTIFPDLSKKLNIKHKVGILEAHVSE